MTNDIQGWISDFKAISVREESAITLCRKHMNAADVKHVLDPTLLLPCSEYDKLCSPRLELNKYVFVYWLGERSRYLNNILSRFANEGYSIVEQSLKNVTSQISIEDWLSHIKYADRVITDSFHGCVFSIIFHKQFSAYKNASGGNTRLHSLFHMLGIDDIVDMEQPHIDYKQVDARLEHLRLSSQEFLKTALDI